MDAFPKQQQDVARAQRSQGRGFLCSDWKSIHLINPVCIK